MASLKIKKLTEKNTDYVENKKIPEPLPYSPGTPSVPGHSPCDPRSLGVPRVGLRAYLAEGYPCSPVLADVTPPPGPRALLLYTPARPFMPGHPVGTGALPVRSSVPWGP